MNNEYKHVQPDQYGEYDWSFFDESHKDEPLPEKKDYEDIKTFKDYELTQCIVYEIAVRNPRYKDEIKYVMQFYEKNKKAIDFILKHHRSMNLEERRFLHKVSELKRLINNIEIIDVNFQTKTLNYKDEKNFGKDIYKLIERIIEREVNISSNKSMIDTAFTKREEGFSIVTSIHLDSKNPMELYPSDPNERQKIIKSLKEKRIFRPNSPKDYFSLHTQYIAQSNSDKARERLYRKKILGSSVMIEEKFQRPALRLDKSLTQKVIAEIDFSKSEKEIMAYVKHIKNFINTKNNGSLSAIDLFMLESFGEKDEEATKILNDKKVSSASMFANMFFVYDYLKALVDTNQRYNDKLENNLKNKIKIIQNGNNLMLNSSEQIEKARNHFKKNKAEVAVSNLCHKDRADEIGISKGLMLKHYNKINSYLIDDRYKNLINSIVGYIN
ncbi:MAG: hypothetical protein DRG78_09300 [Epsilonproteobacteria bacterium]|nr:MAG: hypothetical protein DRG78_09300 [Campylobacterota bacterium]